MPQYRIPELDAATRLKLGLEMLPEIPDPEWGRATELAEEYGISRTLFYQLRDRAKKGLLKDDVLRG